MTAPVPADERRNRVPLILAAGLGALLLLFLLTRLLGGGGDDTIDGGVGPAPTTGPGPSIATTTTTAVPPVESFEVFSTKDPFRPLRATPGGAAPGGTGFTGGTGGGGAPGGAGGTGGAPGGTGGAPGGTGGTTGGTGGTTGGTGGGTGRSAAGAGGASEPARAQRVALIDVFTERGQTVASVRVNDTVHRVSQGETFAGNYKVVSLSRGDGCGRFLFGDDQFRLCKGEEVLK